MMSAKLKSSAKCHHQVQAVPDGLALICLSQAKTTLEGDKSCRRASDVTDVPTALCDSIPKTALQGVCRFGLRLQYEQLSDYLAGQQSAIIIDTTEKGSSVSTTSILDIRTMLDQALPLNIGSRHGFTLAEQLRAAKKACILPKRIIFFGFEVAEGLETDGKTKTVRPVISQPMANTAALVTKMVETLKRGLNQTTKHP